MLWLEESILVNREFSVMFKGCGGFGLLKMDGFSMPRSRMMTGFCLRTVTFVLQAQKLKERETWKVHSRYTHCERFLSFSKF